MGIRDFFKRKPVTAKAVSKTQVRRFTAARPDRLANGFGLGQVTLMEEHRLDLKGLVAHSRHLAQNNDYFRAFLLMCRRHIAGPHGIRLAAQAKRTDGAFDKPDNDLIEAKWAQWGRRGSPTVCGRFSFLNIEQMLSMMIPRDGGVFVRHFQGKEHGVFGYRFQILTVDRLDTDYTIEMADGRYVSGGVECDGLDRPVAFHFRKRKAGASYTTGGERIRIPASEIDYIGMPEDYSVQLSMPWGFTALRRLNMLGGFEEAALTAARAGASKMGFFTRKMDDDADVSESSSPTIEEMEPGSMETLPDGYDVKAFDTGYPDGESPLFVKLMLRGAAAGLGVSYNGLGNDLADTNFSSLHVGKSEERDEWRILQGWFADAFHDLIYRRWLDMAILTGALPLPMSKIEKFQDVAWKPRGWQAVNPVDEVNANISNVESGFTSPQRIAAAKGVDLEDIYTELGEAKKLAEKYGLSLAPLMAPIQPPTTTGA